MLWPKKNINKLENMINIRGTLFFLFFSFEIINFIIKIGRILNPLNINTKGKFNKNSDVLKAIEPIPRTTPHKSSF